ncbi:16S rRNA (uracil(1498)-N(3))-methyltransferase [candidate division KSB1 bacterium]|nr:16S rRNA (uracil(1498)-N(3))-methyltransferase [candidate division KSB1 bacterium]
MLHEELFFVKPEDVDSQTLIISGDEFKHLVHVLRKKVGDSATATDGQGNSFLFQIFKIDASFAQGTIVKKRRRQGEPYFQLTLAQALLKGRHFDLVIEKCTEIGITRFVPMLTARSIGDENQKKNQRWQRIALAAMKQCARSVLPEITAVQGFESILEQHSHLPVKLVADNGADARPLAQILSNHQPRHENTYSRDGVLLIGPEGGFSPEEIELAQQHGYELLSMGPRRLRAETAGVVGSALVLAAMGEL